VTKTVFKSVCGPRFSLPSSVVSYTPRPPVPQRPRLVQTRIVSIMSAERVLPLWLNLSTLSVEFHAGRSPSYPPADFYPFFENVVTGPGFLFSKNASVFRDVSATLPIPLSCVPGFLWGHRLDFFREAYSPLSPLGLLRVHWRADIPSSDSPFSLPWTRRDPLVAGAVCLETRVVVKWFARSPQG